MVAQLRGCNATFYVNVMVILYQNSLRGMYENIKVNFHANSNRWNAMKDNLENQYIDITYS